MPGHNAPMVAGVQQREADNEDNDSSGGERSSSSASSGNRDSESGIGDNDNGSEGDNLQVAAYGFQFVRRVRALPLARWSAGDHNHLEDVPFVSMHLVLLECFLQLCGLFYQMVAVPYTDQYPPTFRFADWALCKLLDVLESMCPCFTALPGEIPGWYAARILDSICFLPRILTTSVTNWLRRVLPLNG